MVMRKGIEYYEKLALEWLNRKDAALSREEWHKCHKKWRYYQTKVCQFRQLELFN